MVVPKVQPELRDLIHVSMRAVLKICMIKRVPYPIALPMFEESAWKESHVCPSAALEDSLVR